MATRYRDSQTGRFAAKATWKRSKSHGGSRYKRERYEPVRKQKEEEITGDFFPEEDYEEWAITFDYP